MSNKFLSASSNSNLTDGSLNLYVQGVTVQELTPSLPVKTNTLNTLISSKLDIDDVEGLQNQLNGKLSNPLIADLNLQTFDLTNGSSIEMAKQASETDAAAGKIKIYYNNDGKLHQVDENGVDTVANLTGDVTITGDLEVTGAIISDLRINDPLWETAIDNPSDLLNVGYFSTYNDGIVNKYTGLIRSKDDKKFHLVDTSTKPISTSTITDSSASLLLNEIEGEKITIKDKITGNSWFFELDGQSLRICSGLDLMEFELRVLGFIHRYGVSVGFVNHQFGGGTLSSPTATQVGNFLYSNANKGYNGTSYVDTSTIWSIALENYALNKTGSDLRFDVTPIGTSSKGTYMLLESSGLTLGTGITTYKLPMVRGTLNQILKTDGSGNVSWQDETALNPFDQNLNIADNPTFNQSLTLDSTSSASLNIDRNATANLASTFYKNNGSALWQVGLHGASDNYDISSFSVGLALSINETTNAVTITAATNIEGQATFNTGLNSYLMPLTRPLINQVLKANDAIGTLEWANVAGVPTSPTFDEITIDNGVDDSFLNMNRTAITDEAYIRYYTNSVEKFRVGMSFNSTGYNIRTSANQEMMGFFEDGLQIETRVPLFSINSVVGGSDAVCRILRTNGTYDGLLKFTDVGDDFFTVGLKSGNDNFLISNESVAKKNIEINKANQSIIINELYTLMNTVPSTDDIIKASGTSLIFSDSTTLANITATTTMTLGSGVTNYTVPTSRASFGNMIMRSAGTPSSVEFTQRMNAQAGAPAITNDNTQGYSINSLWTNETTDTTYVCSDSTTGAAVWKDISTTGGSGDVTGGATSVDTNIAIYNGTTGKIIKNSNAQVNAVGSVIARTTDFTNGQKLQGKLASKTTYTTVQNTLTETDILNYGVSPVSKWVVGDTLKYYLAGKMSSENNDSITVRFYLNNVVISTGLIQVSLHTNNAFCITHELTFHTIGVSGVAYGITKIMIDKNDPSSDSYSIFHEAVSIDTTSAANNLKCTVQWNELSVNNSVSIGTGYLNLI